MNRRNMNSVSKATPRLRQLALVVIAACAKPVTDDNGKVVKPAETVGVEYPDQKKGKKLLSTNKIKFVSYNADGTVNKSPERVKDEVAAFIKAREKRKEFFNVSGYTVTEKEWEPADNKVKEEKPAEEEKKDN